MGEEKAEKKVESSDTVSKNGSGKKRGGGVFSYVAIILAGLLGVAVSLVFLNNQKLHKQIVDLDRQLVILQESDKNIDSRVLALEDELVVLNLKRRLVQVKTSVKGLLDLQGLMADNQDVVVKIQGLVDDLDDEEKKLEQEIAGTTPKVFQSSRPCPQPRYQRCPEPVAIMHPPIPQHKATSAVLTQAASAHAAPKAGGLTAGANSDSWWSKFINLRLFGN